MRRVLYRWLGPILTRLYSSAGKLRPLEMALDMVFTKLFPSIGIPFLEAARSTGSMEGDWDKSRKVKCFDGCNRRSRREEGGGLCAESS